MLNFAIFAIFSIILANKTPSDNWNLASEIRFSTRLWEVEEDSDPPTRPVRSFFFFFLFPDPLAVYHFTEPRFGLHFEQWGC